MNWIIWALISVFLIGTYNTFLEASKSSIPKGYVFKHMYLSSILIISGLINLLVLIYHHKTNKKSFEYFYTKHIKFPYPIILIPAIILSIYMISNILALSGGGGIAAVIINLNSFVTLIAGAMLLGDKINLKIIISALISIFFVGIASLESRKINK